MGFLDNLLNRNPTRDWRRQHGLDLVFDLDQWSFAGIRLGDRADRLQKLGPASSAARARAGSYEYGRDGFGCATEQGRFVELTLWFGAAVVEPPFQGKVRRHGVIGTLTPQSSEADVVALIGAPDEREERPASVENPDEFPPEVSLTWRYGKSTCRAELAGGKLDEIWACIDD